MYSTNNYRDIQRRRGQLCRTLGVPDRFFLAMYHGGVFPGRGIEQFLLALVETPNTAAIILGNGEDAYLQRLRNLAESSGVVNRVLFHPAVSIGSLGSYVSAADVGVLVIQAVCESYYLSSPNKLFENIQAGTPVIGSNYPEISKIVHGYDIGLTVNPSEPSEISAALERIRLDTAMRDRFHRNLVRAKDELCWEKEQIVLRDAYAALLHE